MARIRTFKAEFFDDPKVLECSIPARLLFLGLLPHCDDRGRMQYSLDNLKGKFFSSRLDSEIGRKQVDEFLVELENVDLVELYTHKSPASRENLRAQRWLRVVKFSRHQVINRPGHCSSPYSPDEFESRVLVGKEGSLCQCPNQECVELRKAAELAARNGRPTLRVFLQELSESSVSTHGGVSESVRTHAGLEGIGREGKGILLDPGQSEGAISPPPEVVSEPETIGSETEVKPPWEEGRSGSAALAEFAGSIFETVGIDPNPLQIEVLARSIKVRARSTQSSVEATAAWIAARASWIATSAPPEAWNQWFADIGYVYVQEGDPRLTDRRIDARRTCGGTRCEDGWETVSIGAQKVSRRCSDCEKLWAEDF